MSQNLGLSRNKSLIAAAVGAGVFFIGAAGLFIYHNMVQRKKLKLLQQDIERLNLSLTQVNQELLSLRESRHLSSSRRTSRSRKSKMSSFSSTRSGAESEDDMFSSLNTDDGDEYFDINSDDEILLLSESSANKGEVNKLFEEVDILMKGNDDDRLKAFIILKQNEYEYSENPEFLWRFAKANQIQATVWGAQKDMEAKKKYVFQGLEHASKALALDMSNPDAHKWFAILTGMQGDFVSIKEKIQNGYLFQKHVLAALEIKPDDYSLHYLLGRFKFEVANISWMERKIASSLFAEVPTITYAEAVMDLLKAEELNSVPWKENRLLLAKCYIGDGKYDKAMEWLDSAKEIPSRTKDDEACDQEVDNLIDKYKKYRK